MCVVTWCARRQTSSQIDAIGVGMLGDGSQAAGRSISQARVACLNLDTNRRPDPIKLCYIYGRWEFIWYMKLMLS